MRQTEQTDSTTDPDAEDPVVVDRRRRDRVAGAIVGLSLLLLLVATTTLGFGPYEDAARAARPPTLWDWLSLLIVPLAVAAGAAFIGYIQKRTELDIAEKARDEDREIARQARENEQKIAADRLRQATLEAYYDRMTDLLLEHKLRESAEGSELRSIARARTAAVIRSLDGGRIKQLLAFLHSSGLIEKDQPVIDPARVDLSKIDLSGGDLRGAILRGFNMSEANLSGAALFKANLSRANLIGADLSRADLIGADLSRAYLIGANLSRAYLGGADLSGAYLGGANLIMARYWTIEQLEQAKDIAETIMPDGVRLGGKDIFGDHIEGLTFNEWKVQYLSRQSADTPPSEPAQG